jgi:hypothetical protein
MVLVKRHDPYWTLNVSGGFMSGWAGLGWNLVFGAATLLVAFNYRDAAWRIHGFMANTVLSSHSQRNWLLRNIQRQ